jgi:hypothetical protein
MDPSLTGVAGTQLLGLNTYQKFWMATNSYEDLRIQREIDWDYAKFIGSCSNPKGVQKVDNSDKARRKAEEEERELIRRGGIRDGDTIRIAANSVDDLMHQMEQTMKGEKDWHDNTIDDHEKKLREDYARKKAEYTKIVASNHAEIYPTTSLDGGKFYNSEEVEKSLMARRHAAESPAIIRMRELRDLEEIEQRRNKVPHSIVDGVEFEDPPDISR